MTHIIIYATVSLSLFNRWHFQKEIEEYHFMRQNYIKSIDEHLPTY